MIADMDDGAVNRPESVKVPARRRVVLTGISSRAWEHPADRGALTALRQLRGFDEVIKALTGLWNERGWRLEFLGGSIRVDDRQYPRVHRIFAEAASTLDISELPELYVSAGREPGGSCVGMARPFVVISYGTVELLDDEELRNLLGHELGHLVSGHAVYRTMLEIVTGWLVSLSWLPVGSIALRGIVSALREWWRKAELSADRAGLLAGQDPAAAVRLLMKLAGGGDLSQVDTAAFLAQAAEYDRGGDLRDSLMKIRMVAFRSHPLPVARAAQLRQWIDSGEYGRVLAGEYPRRGEEGASATDDIRAAAESYRQWFARSQDPLVGLLRRLGDGTADVGEWMGAGAGRIRGWMGAAARRPGRAGRSGPSGGGGTAGGAGPGAGGPSRDADTAGATKTGGSWDADTAGATETGGSWDADTAGATETGGSWARGETADGDGGDTSSGDANTDRPASAGPSDPGH